MATYENVITLGTLGIFKGEADSAYQATLVSGTNIKTVNNESILGSGNITISGGASATTATASLAVADWSNKVQTVSVTGVTASNNAIVAPAPSDSTAWVAAGIVCTAQGAGTLTFTCIKTPTAALTANVLILG